MKEEDMVKPRLGDCLGARLDKPGPRCASPRSVCVRGVVAVSFSGAIAEAVNSTLSGASTSDSDRIPIAGD